MTFKVLNSSIKNPEWCTLYGFYTKEINKKKNEGMTEHKELSPDKLKDYISIPYLTIF